MRNVLEQLREFESSVGRLAHLVRSIPRPEGAVAAASHTSQAASFSPPGFQKLQLPALETEPGPESDPESVVVDTWEEAEMVEAGAIIVPGADAQQD